MKVTSLLFFETTALVLASAGYAYGLHELAMASILLGALAAPALVFLGATFVHVTLGLFAALTAVFGLFRLPPLLCAGALAAALIGWDARLLAPQVSSASPEDRRRFAASYALRAGATSCLGLLLIWAAGSIHVSLTFGSGLVLSFAVLVLAALFLRTLRRVEASNSDARPDQK
jgi:hypothetical protein